MWSAFCAVLIAVPPSAGVLPADLLIHRAEISAAHKKKNVLIIFHASWCPWCRKLDALIQDPALRAPFLKSYQMVKIRIRERGSLHRLENPGWPSVMARLRGTGEQDIPYLVVLTPSGFKLADSYRPPGGKIPGNAGYPRTRDEVEAFVDMIERTATGFSQEQLATLKSRLSAQGLGAMKNPSGRAVTNLDAGCG